jgi:hypothetical protein
VSSNGIPVSKFLFREKFKSLNDALGINPIYEIENFDAANDLMTYLSTLPACLIIISLRDKNDLIQVATFMKLFKKIAKDTAVKIVVFNFANDKVFDKALEKLGIQEVVDAAINTKALKFKIDFWMKSLKGQIKNHPNAAPAKAVKPQDNSTSGDKKQDQFTPQWVEALDLEDDIWIIRSDNDCKKILSKWLVRLLGPGPNVGQWTEVKHGVFRFELKESEKQLYVAGKGSWFFMGEQKPEFVWKENTWLMTGHSFELFYKIDTKVYSRLKSKDKFFTIAKNSIFAKTKEALIIESFNKEMVFKREADLLADLEGEGSTDNLDHKPLSGKTNTSAETSGNLSGETAGDKELPNFWKGMNSSSETQKEKDLRTKSEALRESDDLDRKRNDHEHKKFYKNHNEAEKYAGLDELSGKGSTDRLNSHYEGDVTNNGNNSGQGNLEGKSSTDDLSGFYKNSLAKKKDSTSSEEEDSESGAKASDKKKTKHHTNKAHSLNDLSGPSSTDELDGFLNGVINSSKTKAAKNSRNSLEDYSEGGAAYDLDENTETEKLAASFKKKATAASSGNSQNDTDAYAELFGKGKINTASAPSKKKNLKVDYQAETPLNLEEITTDAKVISYLLLGEDRIACTLDDYFDDTVIFHTNDKNVKVPASVELDLVYRSKKQDTILNVFGTVLSIDGDGEGSDYVTIQITQDKASEISSFMERFEERQANINEFLKLVKGT